MHMNTENIKGWTVPYPWLNTAWSTLEEVGANMRAAGNPEETIAMICDPARRSAQKWYDYFEGRQQQQTHKM